jgi:hypothetical protein
LKQRTTGVLNPERATEVINELVVIMLDVAKQLHDEMPEERLKVVDFKAFINFVVFNVDACAFPRELEYGARATVLLQVNSWLDTEHT